MITPTKTVCYAQVEHSKTWHKVLSVDGDNGLCVQWAENRAATWSYNFFSKIKVIEEITDSPERWYEAFIRHKKEKDWHGGVIETECSKLFFPGAACFCGRCATVYGRDIRVESH